MSDHFAAFSFVDRIVEFEPGKRAVGRYDVPAGIAAFPSCLVAEAVGQLAAWVSMEHIAFRGRPVAALATETRFRGDVAPGDTLDLSVDLDSCDDDAVAYSGRAEVRGSTVIELIHCLGPMLPVAEFDAPEALAGRLELLRGPGAAPAQRSTSPSPRRFSAIIFRAGRCFRPHCSSIRRSAWRWASRARRRIGLPAGSPCRRE